MEYQSDLTKLERELVDDAKILEGQCRDFVDVLMDLKNADKSLIVFGRDNVERGFMALIRGITRGK